MLFEEWYDPLISGIRWVDELIEVAGGDSVFPELRVQQSAKDRIVNPAEVIARDPQVIIGSWCGRQVKKNLIRAREGWATSAPFVTTSCTRSSRPTFFSPVRPLSPKDYDNFTPSCATS